MAGERAGRLLAVTGNGHEDGGGERCPDNERGYS
jgi:hypothetical protein